MYDILARVQQKVVDQRRKDENINYDLVFEDVRDDLKKAGRRISIGRVKKHYALARDDIKRHDADWPKRMDLWAETVRDRGVTWFNS